MTKRLLDIDPETGLHTYHEYDHAQRKTVIHYEQDVESVLERNKALANDDRHKRRGIKQEWMHVASIPVVVQMKWLIEHGVDVYNKDHQKKVNQLLQDPEWRYLRTTSGRL